MRLHVEIGGSTRIIALSIERESATVRDLADALGANHLEALWVDGTAHLASAWLSDVPLVDGSQVADSQAVATSPVPDETWLGVNAGPEVGRVKPLTPASSVVIGRNPGNDLTLDNDTVSGQHAQVTRDENNRLAIVDLGSRNGTWVGDRHLHNSELGLEPEVAVHLGSSQVVVRPVDRTDRPLATSSDHANASGRMLFNRPPRRPVPTGPDPIALPDPVADRANPRLSIISLIVPILFAVVIVAITGRLRFALFALMSPVMLLGNYVAGRRRVKSERHSDVETHANALERLREDLEAAVAAERLRRNSIGIDMLEVRRRLQLPSSRLWERRLSDVDALSFRVGVGDVPWAVPLQEKGPGRADAADDVEAVLQEFSLLSKVELLSDLREGALGIFGDSDHGRAAMRSSMLQLAAAHGPADIRFVVVTDADSVHHWDWVHWLPHANIDAGPLVLAGESVGPFADQLLESLEPETGFSSSKKLSLIHISEPTRPY